jgi:eukaryotic-like serine/threonine-protein kinase
MAEGGEAGAALRTAVGGREPVALGERFRIHPAQTVLDMAGPLAEAFAATDSTRPDTGCVALVARPEQFPRVGAAAQLRGLEHPGMVRLLDAGPVNWPDGAQRFAMIYETPAGPPILRKGKRIDPIDARLLARAFVVPVTQLLAELNRRGVAHRAIRPDNIYWYDFGKTRLTLGPATAGPAGALQPAFCEPLELAMCDPYGKGGGVAGDDLFSLGATVLALLRGEWPLADLSDEAILDRRLDAGSWDALAGKYHPPTEMYDLLRGLLCDDPAERWSLPTVAKWAEGSRPQLPRFTMPAKAREPFLFEGKLLRTGREIAIAMGRHPQPAAAAVRSGVMRDWARRALPDDTAAKKIEALSGPGSHAGRDGDGPLVARACLALDPLGPLRVGGICVRPDGYASALARAFVADRAQLPALDSAIRAGLHLEWVEAQKAALPNQKGMRRFNSFERLGRWASESSVGSGLERCLYELDPRMPCLSPLSIDGWVETAGDLLPEIDRALEDDATGQTGFDRHVPAFLAARVAADEAALRGLSAGIADEETRLAALRLLAELQETYLVGSLPNLARQCATLIRPTLERYQRVSTKELIQHRAEAAIAQGDLRELVRLVDDKVGLEADQKGFTSAKNEYTNAIEKLSKADLVLLDRARQATYRGRETAALAAGSLALAMFFVVLALHLG